LDAGIFEAARRGKTSEQLIGDVFLARRLNTILDGPFFGPWDLNEVPSDVIEQILSIEQYGEIKAGFAKVEAKMKEWREKHGRK
jgi:hypothetical protein